MSGGFRDRRYLLTGKIRRSFIKQTTLILVWEGGVRFRHLAGGDRVFWIVGTV